MPLTAAPDAIERELHIEARPETVFSFFTDESKLLRWMGRVASADARPGGTIRIDYNGFDIMRGQFVEITPHSRIVFTWGWETLAQGVTRPGESRVEVTFTPDAGGTRLRVVHTGLSEMERAGHTNGWDNFLPKLIEAARSGEQVQVPPSLNDAEAYASRLNTLLVSLREALEGASEDAGRRTSAGTGWPAAVTAHHVIGHLALVPFIVATSKGERAPQADFTVEALAQYNADFARQSADATVSDALGVLLQAGPTAVDTVKALEPASLETAVSMAFAGRAQLSARQLIEGPLLGDIAGHIAEVQAALGRVPA